MKNGILISSVVAARRGTGQSVPVQPAVVAYWDNVNFSYTRPNVGVPVVFVGHIDPFSGNAVAVDGDSWVCDIPPSVSIVEVSDATTLQTEILNASANTRIILKSNNGSPKSYKIGDLYFNNTVQILGEQDSQGNNLVTIDAREPISGFSIGGSGKYEAVCAGMIANSIDESIPSGVNYNGYFPYKVMQLFWDDTPLNAKDSAANCTGVFDYYYDSVNNKFFLSTAFGDPSSKSLYFSRYAAFTSQRNIDFTNLTSTNMCDGLIVANLNFIGFGGNAKNAVINDRVFLKFDYTARKYHGVFNCNFFACRGGVVKLPLSSTIRNCTSEHCGWGSFAAGYIESDLQIPKMKSNNTYNSNFLNSTRSKIKDCKLKNVNFSGYAGGYDTAKFGSLSFVDVDNFSVYDAGTMNFPHRSFSTPGVKGIWFDFCYDYTLKNSTVNGSTGMALHNEIGSVFEISGNQFQGFNQSALQYFECAIYNSTSTSGSIKNNDILCDSNTLMGLRQEWNETRGSDSRFGTRKSDNLEYSHNRITLGTSTAPCYLYYKYPNDLSPNNFRKFFGTGFAISNNIYSNYGSQKWQAIGDSTFVINPSTYYYTLAQFQALSVADAWENNSQTQ